MLLGLHLNYIITAILCHLKLRSRVGSTKYNIKYALLYGLIPLSSPTGQVWCADKKLDHSTSDNSSGYIQHKKACQGYE
jgi:hypothetical protein